MNQDNGTSNEQDVDGTKELKRVADFFEKRKIDGVVGFAVALDDHPERASTPGITQLVLFCTRAGEEAVPPERAVVLLRGFSENLRQLAGELALMAADLERTAGLAVSQDAN